MQKERKTLVMRVGRSHEGFMFVFSVVPASTRAIYIFRLGQRPRTRRRHSGRRNFKPKIPSVSEDNYLRKASGILAQGRAGYRGEALLSVEVDILFSPRSQSG